MKTLLLGELVINAILVGLIWLVQVLTYPSFYFVGSENYIHYHRFHVSAITPLVAPLMIAELFLCAYNAYSSNYSSVQTSGNTMILTLTLIALLVIIWLTTSFLSVPIHNQLILSKDAYLIKKLVLSNWIRTICWTLKLAILFYIVRKNLNLNVP